MASRSPIDPFIKKQGVLFLDGGLATELEQHGHNLKQKLWSAQMMRTSPEARKDVHLSYLNAGADCIITASYQASIPGCIEVGMTKKEAVQLLKDCVNIALDAREEYMQQPGSSHTRIQPIVANSIGPYGAYLANGAEYTGNYSISKDELRTFHGSRWEVLADGPNELFACETIPNFEEAEVLLELIRQSPNIWAYVSFSCTDGEHISDGTPILECAALFESCPQVVAVGVNCTAPVHISKLIGKVKAGAPSKVVVVYPNSGGQYDGKKRTWTNTTDVVDLAELAEGWLTNGGLLIGGCCRTGPAHISAMRTKILG